MKHEQGVADVFNRFLTKKARERSKRVRPIALDGQDCDAADYLITDESRFALIEFKHTKADIKHEGKKHRRCRLCKLLEADEAMRALHDQCHFIAWMETPRSQVQLNIYRHEVCNGEIFGDKCDLKTRAPSGTYEVPASRFAREFFDATGTRTLSVDAFERYLAWLMSKASESDRTTLEILIDDSSDDECTLVRFDSIRQVYDWFQTQRQEERL